MWRDFPLPGGRTGRPESAGQAGAADPAAPGGFAPAAARPAATVLLVDDGVRVFTLRRRRSMAFAPGMLVFPGGAVEPADGELGARQSPELPAAAVAAVRETFEECGVLLAVPRAGGERLEGLAPATVEGLRQDLLAGRRDLADVLGVAGAQLSGDLLHPWAHWVTPTFEPRRFDTLFYLARVPAGQEPRHVGGEGEAAGWLDAAEAVRLHGEGLLPMLPPTLVCLEELAAARGVDELFATRRRLRPVSPWLAEAVGANGVVAPVLRVHLDGAGGGDPS